MKKICFVISILTLNTIFSQDNCFDTIKKLDNQKITKLWYSLAYNEDRNSESNFNKTLIYSDDTLLLSVIKCGKENATLLLDMLNDSTKDYAANVALYMLFKRDGTILVKNYFGVEKIESWRALYKDEDLKYWKNYLQ